MKRQQESHEMWTFQPDMYIRQPTSFINYTCFEWTHSKSLDTINFPLKTSWKHILNYYCTFPVLYDMCLSKILATYSRLSPSKKASNVYCAFSGMYAVITFYLESSPTVPMHMHISLLVFITKFEPITSNANGEPCAYITNCTDRHILVVRCMLIQYDISLFCLMNSILSLLLASQRSESEGERVGVLEGRC